MREEELNELDRAVRSRLARLGGAPVDTTNLERRLSAAIAREMEPPVARTRSSLGFRRWMPVSSLAAALALTALLIGVVMLGTSPSPVIAAPADLARLHADMGNHASMATKVSSLDEANRVLAEKWADAPLLPAGSMPVEHIQACCLHDLKARKVVCVIMHDREDTAITMVVARAQDVKCPGSGMVVERNGRKYIVHDADGLRMVMTEGNGKYVCLMGSVSTERLLEIAAGLSL